jgi:hypothetical protein
MKVEHRKVKLENGRAKTLSDQVGVGGARWRLSFTTHVNIKVIIILITLFVSFEWSGKVLERQGLRGWRAEFKEWGSGAGTRTVSKKADAEKSWRKVKSLRCKTGTWGTRLERKGEMIGNNNLWIAAHAKAAGLVLVTNDEREFRRVRGLKVQNWAA